MMKETNIKRINRYSVFFLIVFIYLLLLAIITARNGYNGSFLILNQYNADWLDWPMFIITHLGDSMILASILSIILVWKRPDAVVVIIITVIITGLTGQFLKAIFFEGWDRPLRVFNESNLVHTLPNYRLFHNSFPSGHSITAMSLLTALILCLRPKFIHQVSLAFLVTLITYSRIYLGVHFPGDVLAGSIIGITLTLLITHMLFPKVSALKYSENFKRAIAIISIALLTIGVYVLRVYYPLI